MVYYWFFLTFRLEGDSNGSDSTLRISDSVNQNQQVKKKQEGTLVPIASLDQDLCSDEMLFAAGI